MLFFKSLKNAEGYLEPIDVTNGEYVGYDSEGRLLDIRVVPVPVRLFFGLLGWDEDERVVISCAEQEPTHGEELSHLLIRDLRSRWGGWMADKDLEGQSLCRLVLDAVTRGGWD